MARPNGKATWQCHIAKPYGKAIWQCHMAKPYGIAIWQSHMAMPYGKAIWQCHMARPYGTAIWHCHMAAAAAAAAAAAVYALNSPGNFFQEFWPRKLYVQIMNLYVFNEKSNLFCIFGYRSLQNRTESEIFWASFRFLFRYVFSLSII